MKVSSSNRVFYLLIHNSITFTLHHILLTFCDTGKEFEFTGDLFKMTSDKNYIRDLAKISDDEVKYNFEKEKNFDIKSQNDKSTQDRILIKLLKSPGLMITASGVSKTIFLSPDPDELCNRLTLFLQEKHVGKNLI